MGRQQFDAIERICKKCETLKPIDDFYKYTTGTAYWTECKLCVCKSKKKTTPRKKRIYTSKIVESFNEIPKEIIAEIKKEIDETQPTLKWLCRKYGFKYTHMLKWHANGLL
jgi:hypothetical protein